MVSIARKTINDYNDYAVVYKRPRKKLRVRKEIYENAGKTRYSVLADTKEALKEHWKFFIGFNTAFWGGGYALAYGTFMLSH